MNKKQRRMSAIFTNALSQAYGEPRGTGKLQLTARAIWMSARELASGDICMYAHGEGDGIRVELSPTAVMSAFDQYGGGEFTCYIDAEEPSLEIYGSNSAERGFAVMDWEDMLAAGRKTREAPQDITISGKVYTKESAFESESDAREAVATIRNSGKNAQMRKKGGMFVVYVRDKPAKKAKPAKKPAKKAAKKKAKQPKAKKPSAKSPKAKK